MRSTHPGEPDYPRSLLDLEVPPQACHWCGPLWPPSPPSVALVGARAASSYGVEMAETIGFELGRRGVTVVSGLARGVDAAAHRGALAAGGPAVAVVACDPATPPLLETAALYRRLLATGSVCAEFDATVAPRPGLFLRRNRIVAALSDLVVVIEAGTKSGALETAACARRLGRAVATVPGDVTRAVAGGPLLLLQSGARAVGSAADVLQLLRDRRGDSPASDSAPEDGARVGGDPLLSLLRKSGPQHADALARRLGWDPGRLLARLAEEELAGAVYRGSDGRYRVRRGDQAQ